MAVKIEYTGDKGLHTVGGHWTPANAEKDVTEADAVYLLKTFPGVFKKVFVPEVKPKAKPTPKPKAKPRAKTVKDDA